MRIAFYVYVKRTEPGGKNLFPEKKKLKKVIWMEEVGKDLEKCGPKKMWEIEEYREKIAALKSLIEENGSKTTSCSQNKN